MREPNPFDVQDSFVKANIDLQMSIYNQNRASQSYASQQAQGFYAAYGIQNMLSGGRRECEPSKREKAEKYAAEVRARFKYMTANQTDIRILFQRVKDAANQANPVLDADPVPAGTATGQEPGISTAECH
jgi:hypothetical protein